MAFDIGDILGEVRAFAEDAMGDDADKYKDALAQGLEGVEKARKLLEKIQSGDKAAVEVELTEWEDVNRTNVAIAKMDAAIVDAENGISLDDVVGVISKVVKVVGVVGGALL